MNGRPFDRLRANDRSKTRRKRKDLGSRGRGNRVSDMLTMHCGDGPLYPLQILRPRQVAKLLINYQELPHHAQILVIENVAVEHIRSVKSGISIEADGDNYLTLGIHQHGVLPT